MSQRPALDAATILAEHVRRWRSERTGSLVVGLCGAQGSGKSTVAAKAASLLHTDGLVCVTVALDDLYLSKEDRLRLAREVHPLFETRGPPGTHDVALGLSSLRRLRAGETTAIPIFDKLADDREAAAREERGPVDVVLFEGWCVGAAQQSEAALAEPINALERDEDPDGAWRRSVAAALAGPYRQLFAELDKLAFLQAPGFDLVLRWRLQQEEANAYAAAADRRAKAMDAGQVARFIQHYERLTRWMLAELPARADLVIALDAERRVVAVRSPAG